MKMIATVAMGLVVTAGAVFAQTMTDPKADLAAAKDEARTADLRVRESKDFQVAVEKATSAEQAYRDALSRDPEMASIDSEITRLREQMRTLVERKAETETRLAAGRLAGLKEARDEAHRTVRNIRLSKGIRTSLQKQEEAGRNLADAEKTQEETSDKK